MRIVRFLAAFLSAGIVFGGGIVHAQFGAPPYAVPPEVTGLPEWPGAEPDESGAPPDPTEPPSKDEPADETLPSTEEEPPLLLPDTTVLQAQFTTSMEIVDAGVAALVPILVRTVADLKRLALTPISPDPAIANNQRRLLDHRIRELAYEDTRLASYERTLARWRGGIIGPSEVSASVMSGVRQRSDRLAVYRRQIECGRYFARAAARTHIVAAQGGAPRRTVVPPGC